MLENAQFCPKNEKSLKFLQKDLEVSKLFVPLQSQNKAVVVKW